MLSGCCALTFASGEAKPRNHSREMPAQLDLFGFGEEAEEFCFVAVQETGLSRGNFFGGVRRAHSYNGVFVPEALNEFPETPRARKDNLDDFIGSPNRATVRSFEHGGNFLTTHVAKKCLAKI
jgi:hypothetical protein